MNHLFLASVVIVATSIVLVLNAQDDTATLDRRLGISPARTDLNLPGLTWPILS